MARKSVSKKTRFEVFKRDRFTCQYCGAKAPDVILHLDHIEAVANGGTNDILNLIAACADCNGGKGARKLDDRSAVERQRAQIEELAERREQLEMLLAWRDAEQSSAVDIVEQICDRVGRRGGGYVPNESGKAHIRRWLKRFSLAEVLAALDESFDHYMQFDGDKPNPEAWEKAFAKIPAIASLQRQAVDKPYIPKLAYIQGILRKQLDDPHGKYLADLEDIHGWGVPLDFMEARAKRTGDYGDYWGEMVERATADRKGEDR